MDHLYTKCKEIAFLQNSSEMKSKKILELLASLTARQISSLQINGLIHDQLIEMVLTGIDSIEYNPCDCGCLMVELEDHHFTQLKTLIREMSNIEPVDLTVEDESGVELIDLSVEDEIGVELIDLSVEDESGFELIDLSVEDESGVELMDQYSKDE